MLCGVYPERGMKGILRFAQNDKRRAQHDNFAFFINLLSRRAAGTRDAVTTRLVALRPKKAYYNTPFVPPGPITYNVARQRDDEEDEMRRYALRLGVSLLVFAAAAAAAPVKTESVQFKSGDEAISGYLAVPESPGAHAALV